MATFAPPTPTAPVHGHRAGTVLDVDAPAPETALPGLAIGAAIFAAATIFYFLIGYKTTISQHVVVFDALDRFTRAYMVWFNSPPKLAAIGFVFPPLTTFVLLPFAVIKPLASGLIALLL